MNILQKISRALFPPPPASPDYLKGLLSVANSEAGHTVTKALCLGYPPIRKAVMLIANRAASLPLFAMRYGVNDEKKRDWAHPGYRILMEQSNDYLTPFVLKRELFIDAIFGNGLAYILRDEFAQPSQLLLLDPEQTTIEGTQDGGLYSTVLNRTRYRIPSTDVFHLRSIGRELLADPLIDIARNALGLSLSLQNFSAKFFKQGVSGLTFVELPPYLADIDKRKQFVEDYRRNNEGQRNAHKTIFTPPQTKITHEEADYEKSQVLQSHTFDLIRIANLFGCEPHKLGSNIQTSYSSLVEQNQSFLDECLNPHLVAFEQEADAKLRTETEKRLGRLYFEFERKALLTMSPQEELDLIEKELNAGLVSEEFARRKLNLPEADEKETYRRPSNVSIVGEEPDPQPQEQPQQQPPMMEQQQQEQGNEAQQTAKDLTRSILSRLLKRIAKSKGPLSSHREIMIESLNAYPQAEEFVEGFISRYGEELDSVLPEQREQVIEAMNIDTMLEELCK